MKKTILLSLFLATAIIASPILQMNRAFFSLSDLIPYITDRDKFMDKENEALLSGKIIELQSAFKDAKHDTLLKEDLFAPSYALINENIANSLDAFKKGKKDYAHFRLKEITTHCMDCHTRLPPSHTSSFQNGEFSIDEKKFENTYNLGIAQLIVRRYVDAKWSFKRTIDDSFVKKDFSNVMLPFKQLLLIETKVLKDPANLISHLKNYIEKKELPEEARSTLKQWVQRLEYWNDNPLISKGLKTKNDVDKFISKDLSPLKKKAFLKDGFDVDLLLASGLLSNYLFENPTSSKAPEISFWLGWTEKHLKRENFFGSGDLFLKQCVKRYPTNPIANKCLDEYKESVEFEFTGSSGTHIPSDVKKELDDLGKLIKSK